MRLGKIYFYFETKISNSDYQKIISNTHNPYISILSLIFFICNEYYLKYK